MIKYNCLKYICLVIKLLSIHDSKLTKAIKGLSPGN